MEQPSHSPPVEADHVRPPTVILKGGRGVECALRGDIKPAEGAPLGVKNG